MVKRLVLLLDTFCIFKKFKLFFKYVSKCLEKYNYESKLTKEFKNIS